MTFYIILVTFNDVIRFTFTTKNIILAHVFWPFFYITLFVDFITIPPFQGQPRLRFTETVVLRTVPINKTHQHSPFTMASIISSL